MRPIQIAIAEDHHMLRDALANALEKAGIRVSICAENGADLIKQIEIVGLPMLCIIDIQMPVMDGIQAATYIKNKWPDIKIIAFSMNANQNTITEVLNKGAHLYFPKSISTEKLLSAIHDLCQ